MWFFLSLLHKSGWLCGLVQWRSDGFSVFNLFRAEAGEGASDLNLGWLVVIWSCALLVLFQGRLATLLDNSDPMAEERGWPLEIELSLEWRIGLTISYFGVSRLLHRRLSTTCRDEVFGFGSLCSSSASLLSVIWAWAVAFLSILLLYLRHIFVF